MLELLLEAGADPQSLTLEGRMPLDLAMEADEERSHRRAVALLKQVTRVVSTRL